MNIKGFHWALALVGLVLGLLLAVQFRVTREIQQTPYVQQPNNLVAQLSEARKKRESLQEEVTKLRERLDDAAQGPQMNTLKQELDRTRLAGGLMEVTGPGVEISLNDSNMAVQPGEDPNLRVLHDEDVLKVLNEIKAAGAEALALNGQRLVSASEIRCIGPTILTNRNQRLTPPFIITALGNPENIENSLQMRGGVIEQLKFWDIQVSVRRMDHVTIPALTAGMRFDYARPVEAEEGEGSR